MMSVSSEPDAATMALREAVGLKHRRILLVTPDRAMIKRCRDVAVSHDFAVELAECGVDALNKARQLPPDLVVLDLELRDVHGLEVVRWLRSSPTLQSIPIIAATAFGSDPSDPRLAQSGVLAVLRKPLRAVELERWFLHATE